MSELAKPYEIYEWKDGETREFTIVKYELGELEIHPRDGRAAKTVPVMRIHVPAEEKTDFPSYWDLTSQRLVAQLKGILPEFLYNPFKVKVTAIGAPPATHFSVTRLPEQAA
jgi:hypothetical protein